MSRVHEEYTEYNTMYCGRCLLRLGDWPASAFCVGEESVNNMMKGVGRRDERREYGKGAMCEPIGLRRKVKAQDAENVFLRKSAYAYQSTFRNLCSHCRENMTSRGQYHVHWAFF